MSQLKLEPTISKVHEDSRGEMYAITLGDRELILLHSKAGTLRGGHSHDVPEQVMVLTGKMRYRKMRYPEHNWPPASLRHDRWAPPERQPAILRDGQASFNSAGQIHMGEFLEDTWLVEWKVCPDKHSWKNKDYAPWRERVMANATS